MIMNHFKHFLSLTESKHIVAIMLFALPSVTWWLILPWDLRIHPHMPSLFTCVSLTGFWGHGEITMKFWQKKLNTMADYAMDYKKEESLWWLIIFILSAVNIRGADQTIQQLKGHCTDFIHWDKVTCFYLLSLWKHLRGVILSLRK